MFQMIQYSIKGIVFKKFTINPVNDNEITSLVLLFTEITLWYTIYVHWSIEGRGKGVLPPPPPPIKIG